MSIVKLKRVEEAFEILPRATLQDNRLSLDALGALVRLASLPGNWEWQVWHLEKKVLKVGRDYRRRIFNELEAAGYLKREKNNNGNGRWEHTYNLQLLSAGAASTSDALSVAGESTAGSPTAGQGVDKENSRELENTELENTQPPPAAAQQVVVSGGSHLIFDKAIDQNLHQQLSALLQNVEPKLAQQMLDVVAGMGNKALYPIKLIKSFIANQADFDLTPGLSISRKRENERLAAEKRKMENEEKKKPYKNISVGKMSAADALKKGK